MSVQLNAQQSVLALTSTFHQQPDCQQAANPTVSTNCDSTKQGRAHYNTHNLRFLHLPRPHSPSLLPLKSPVPFQLHFLSPRLAPSSSTPRPCFLPPSSSMTDSPAPPPRRSARDRRSLQPTLNESALSAELRDGERALARRSRKTLQEEKADEYKAAQEPRNGTARRRPGESEAELAGDEEERDEEDEEEDEQEEEEEEEEADETEKRAAARKPRQRAATSANTTPRRARQRAEASNDAASAPPGTATSTPARKRGRPTGSTPVSARTSTPSSSRRPALTEDILQPEEEQFTRLWHSVARSSQSLKSMVRQLLDQYTSSSVREQRHAKADLINFLLEAVGSVSGLTVSEVLQLDDESEMMGLLERYEDSGMIVHADAPVRRIKKFESRLSEFMQRLYGEIGIERLTSDSFLHTTLPAFVITFSRSQIRSYRLTMTVACAGMMSGLIAQAVEMERQSDTAKQQLQAAESRRTKPSSALLQQLREQVKEVSSNLSFLHSLLKKLVDSVIIHRYRDVDEHIRSLTLTTLTSCIQQYPSYFCDDTHLRYVGWLLSDKQPMVRRAAISGLVTLYSSATVDMIRRFQTFTDRFMPRFNEMCEDVDDGVAAAAVEFFTVLLRIEMLEEQQGSHVPVLMWDETQHVRRAAAAFVYQDTFATTAERKEDEADAKRDEVHQTDLEQVCRIFHHYCPLFQRGRDKASESKGGQQRSKREREHEHQVPLNRRVLVHGSAVSELQESNWQQPMDLMVEGLFGQVTALRDWTTMYNMIRAGEEDDKKKAGRGRGSRQSTAKGKGEEAGKSSDRSKLTLIHLLLACTKRVMALVENTKDKERDEREEMASGLSLFLIDHLPALLTLYLSSPQPLSLLLRLSSYVRFGDYHSHRKHSAFTSLLALLKKIMTSSVDDSVLAECGLAWRQVMKDNTSYEQEAQHALDELVMELRETVRQEWEGVTASESQTEAGRAAKELLEDDDKATAVLAVCKRILALSQPLHLQDIAYSSPQLYHIYHELLPVLADRRYQASPSQQDLLLCVLRILFADIIWRMAELDRTTPSRSEMERLIVQRNDLCSLLHRLLEHSEVYEVRDVCFSMTSDVFVLFSGKLAGGVLNELALNRERVNTLSRAFDDYFRQLMEGSDVEIRMQQEKEKRQRKEGDDEDEDEDEGQDTERTSAYVSDMRVRAVLAACHVVCYDHNAKPTFSTRQSTFTPQLRHELLTASFLSHFLSADDECLPVVRQAMQLLRTYSALLLLQCQLVTLVHRYEHHSEEEEVRKLAARFAQSWPPAHPTFLPLLRAAVVYACEDPTTRLTFLDVITPFINKASREDAVQLREVGAQQRQILANMKGDEAALRPNEKQRYLAYDNFVALIAKKAGKATATAPRAMERGTKEAEEAEGEETEHDRNGSRTPRRSAGEASIQLTPLSRRTPTTAESTRSIVSLGLSPVREVREEEEENKASRKRGRAETEEGTDGGEDEQQIAENEEQEEQEEDEPSHGRTKRSKASKGRGRGRGGGRGKGRGRASR